MLLLLGGGGMGGYWYFYLDAQWPLPFMSDATPVESSDDQEDSLLVAAADSGAMPEDTSITQDSTMAEPETPEAALPNTGTLVLRGMPRGAQVRIDGTLVESDSLEVEPRTYKVEVERTGYEKYETSTAVGRGQNVVLQVEMQRVAEPAPVQQAPTQPPAQTDPGVDLCSQDPPTDIEYFRSRTCFDTPPRELRAPVASAPEGFGGDLEAVQVLVKVSVNGNAMLVLPGGRRQSAAPELQIAARHFGNRSVQTPAVTPVIDPSVFIAPGAVVLGNVIIGTNSSVWYNTVVRGDMAPITIGDETNIQDLSMLHVDEGFP
jgi:hypothetical protein